MERIRIHEENNTPYVLFEGNKGSLLIRGRSISEDATNFYKPIMKGLDEYAKDPQDILEVTLDYEFFNTSSARAIYKLLKKLNNAEYKVLVQWIYEEGDEDMKEAGEDFNDMMKDLDFEFIEKEEER